MYDKLPYSILLTLRRGLRDDVETAQRIQSHFRKENDAEQVAVWKSNEEFYQEHLDLVDAIVGK